MAKKKVLKPHESKFVMLGMVKTLTRIKDGIADFTVQRQIEKTIGELRKSISMIGD